MFTYSNAKLEELSVHFVDSNEKLILSEEPFQLDGNELQELVSSYMISAFKEQQSFRFFHETDLKYNEAYSFCSEIFHSPKRFHKISIALAKHLSNASKHPAIKPGELFVARFSQFVVEDNIVDGIVLLKSENKKDFLLVDNKRQKTTIKAYKGLDLQKVDKACIVFNMNEEEGFRVFVVDTLNKGIDAQYWKDEFLKLKSLEDSYNFTKNFLSATKDFITTRLPSDFEVEKTDQIDYLNRSVNYFRENETFNIKEFEKNVFEDPAVIKSFQKFGSSYIEQNDIDIADTFQISTQALKKQERIFKSVLKLDKNFHVYIHGRSDLLEKGYDNKKGKHYYKIYFDEEK